MSENWYSIVEYARHFNVSDMTIRRRIKTGKLNAVLKDGKYYIPVNDGPSMHKSIEPQMATGRPSFKQEYMQTERVRFDPLPEQRSVPQQPLIKNNIQTTTRPMQVEMPRMVSQTQSMIQTSKPMASSTSSVDTKVVTEFCETILNKLDEVEKSLKTQADKRVVELEEIIKAKDFEISTLNQQLEDLQVLIKILENKK